MHVASDEGASDIEIIGVYMPSACYVTEVEHKVSLLSDGVLGVIVHMNMCEGVECHFRGICRIPKSNR